MQTHRPTCTFFFCGRESKNSAQMCQFLFDWFRTETASKFDYFQALP